jgi:hypothetical protein
MSPTASGSGLAPQHWEADKKRDTVGCGNAGQSTYPKPVSFL